MKKKRSTTPLIPIWKFQLCCPRKEWNKKKRDVLSEKPKIIEETLKPGEPFKATAIRDSKFNESIICETETKELALSTSWIQAMSKTCRPLIFWMEIVDDIEEIKSNIAWPNTMVSKLTAQELTIIDNSPNTTRISHIPATKRKCVVGSAPRHPLNTLKRWNQTQPGIKSDMLVILVQLANTGKRPLLLLIREIQSIVKLWKKTRHTARSWANFGDSQLYHFQKLQIPLHKPA